MPQAGQLSSSMSVACRLAEWVFDYRFGAIDKSLWVVKRAPGGHGFSFGVLALGILDILRNKYLEFWYGGSQTRTCL
jgi:hypothetical protein